MPNKNDEYIPQSGKALTPAGYECNLIEEITGGAKQILTDHASIHEGLAYTVANKMDIASTKVGAISIAVPEGTYVHFKPAKFVNVGGPVYLSLLEDYTFTGGSAITPVNRKRTGTVGVSACTVKGSTDITAVAGSTPVSLDMKVLPGSSTGASHLGGDFGAAEEWILRPGKTYLVTMTNATSPGAQVTVGYELFWYEEAAG